MVYLIKVMADPHQFCLNSDGIHVEMQATV